MKVLNKYVERKILQQNIHTYLGPEWLQSNKNQMDLEKEVLSALAQPCAPAKKIKVCVEKKIL